MPQLVMMVMWSALFAFSNTSSSNPGISLSWGSAETQIQAWPSLVNLCSSHRLPKQEIKECSSYVEHLPAWIMSEVNPSVMLNIMQLAETNAEAARQPLSMLFCLDAYEEVLPRLGIDKSKDLVYYQALLQLNINGLVQNSKDEPKEDPCLSHKNNSSSSKESFSEKRSYSLEYPIPGYYNSSINQFLKKCRLMILSDAFRGWKMTHSEEMRNQLYLRAFNAKAMEFSESMILKHAFGCWTVRTQENHMIRALLLVAEQHYAEREKLKCIRSLRRKAQFNSQLSKTVECVKRRSDRKRTSFALHLWKIEAQCSKYQLWIKKNALELVIRKQVFLSWSGLMRIRSEDRRTQLKISIRFWHYRVQQLHFVLFAKPDCFVQSMIVWIDFSFSIDFEHIMTSQNSFQRFQQACPIKLDKKFHGICKRRLLIFRKHTLITFLRVWRHLCKINRRYQHKTINAMKKFIRYLHNVESELMQQLATMKRKFILQKWHRISNFESSFRNLRPLFIQIQDSAVLKRTFKNWKSFNIAKGALKRHSSSWSLAVWRKELHKKISFRSLNEIALGFARKRYRACTFSFWRLSLVKKINIRQFFESLSCAHSNLMISNVFKQWIRAFSYRKQLGSRKKLAVGWNNHQVKYFAFKRWKETQLFVIRIKRITASVDLVLKTLRCKRFFDALLGLQRLKYERQILHYKSKGFFQTSRCKEAILKLKHNVTKQKLDRSCFEQIRISRAHQFWRLWMYLCVLNQVNRHILRLHFSFLFKRFRTGVSNQQQSEEHTLKCFRNRRRRLTLSFFLYDWASTFSLCFRLEKLMNKATTWNSQFIKKNNFQKWRHRYKMNLKIDFYFDSVRSAHEKKQKQQTFKTWIIVLHRRQSLHHEFSRIVTCCHRNLLKITLRQWQFVFAAHLAFDVKAKLFLRACRRRQHVQIFRKWRALTNTLIDKFEVAAKSRYRLHLFLSFKLWIQLFEFHRLRGKKLKRACIIMQRNFCRLQFRRFNRICSFVSLQYHRLVRCLQIGTTESLRRSFISWRNGKINFYAKQKIHHLWTKNVLRQGWTIWQNSYLSRLTKKQILLQERFKKWIHQRSSLGMIQRNIRDSHRSSIIVKFWKLWRRFYLREFDASCCTYKNLLHTFFKWRSSYSFILHLEELIDKASSYYNRHILAKFFERVKIISWLSQTTPRVKTMAKSYLQQRVIIQWWRASQAKRLAAKCSLLCACNYLRLWKSSTDLKIQENVICSQIKAWRILRTFAYWKRATETEKNVRTKVIQLREFRLKLHASSAICMMLRYSRAKRSLRCNSEKCHLRLRQIRLSQAISCLYFNRHFRQRHRTNVLVLNRRLLKRIMIERWVSVWQKFKVLKVSKARAVFIRVKSSFRCWTSRLSVRVRLAECRYRLQLSKIVWRWRNHIQKKAQIIVSAIGAKDFFNWRIRKSRFICWRSACLSCIVILRNITASEVHYRSHLLVKFWAALEDKYMATRSDRCYQEKVNRLRDRLRMVRGYLVLSKDASMRRRFRGICHDILSASNLISRKTFLRAWLRVFLAISRAKQSWRALLWRHWTRAVIFTRLYTNVTRLRSRNLTQRCFLFWYRSKFVKSLFTRVMTLGLIRAQRLRFLQWHRYVRQSILNRHAFALLQRRIVASCPLLVLKLIPSTNLVLLFGVWCQRTRESSQQRSAIRQASLVFGCKRFESD